MESVKPISFEKCDVGFMMKQSKQHFKWRLSLDGQLTTIEVLSSKMSGRRRILRDGVMIADKQQFEGAFTHSFHIMNHTMTVMQHGEHFELRIDNVSFSHLHAQEQTKNQFVYEGTGPAASESGNAGAKFDFGGASGGSAGMGNNPSQSYDHPGGRQMMGFGNTSDKPEPGYGQKFLEMTGLGPTKSTNKGSTYTVKHVKRRPGGPARRTGGVGGAAAARGWDDVAEAKQQAFAEGNEEWNGEEEGTKSGGAFDFDSWGKNENAAQYENSGGFKCHEEKPAQVSVKQAFKRAQTQKGTPSAYPGTKPGVQGPPHRQQNNQRWGNSGANQDSWNGFSQKGGLSGGWPSAAASSGANQGSGYDAYGSGAYDTYGDAEGQENQNTNETGSQNNQNKFFDFGSQENTANQQATGDLLGGMTEIQI